LIEGKEDGKPLEIGKKTEKPVDKLEKDE